MKASICLLLGVAVFSTLFLESSTASTAGDGGLLGGVVGGVGNLLEAAKKLLAQLLGNVTTTVDKVTGLLTGVGNEVDTLATNATGATKDVLTKLQTIIVNALDTVAKIPTVLASGTTESLDETRGLIATFEGLLKQFADIVAGNPEIATSLKNVDAVLATVLELVGSLTKVIDTFEVKVSA